MAFSSAAPLKLIRKYLKNSNNFLRKMEWGQVPIYALLVKFCGN